MAFTTYEWVWILRQDGWTDLKTSNAIGVVERTVSKIKNGQNDGARQAALIEQLGLESIALPWSDAANYQMRAMLNLVANEQFNDLYRYFGFTARSTVDAVLSAARQSTPDAAEWGRVLISYAFLLGMRLSKNDTHRAASAGWDEVSQRLLEMLSGRTEAWAKVLRFKVLGNIVVIPWKSASAVKRRSAEMTKLIENSGYFEALEEFSQIIPKNAVAPFNALAIASAFGWEEHFESLFDKLVLADPKYRDFANVEDNEIDEDFDAFLRWLLIEQTPPASEKTSDHLEEENDDE